MKLNVRRTQVITETASGEADATNKTPMRRAAVIAIVENPYAGESVQDLQELIAASPAVGQQMAEALAEALGDFEVQSYGKAGLVGANGEQEHANALLTTAFAEPFRAKLGGTAWISSVTKVAYPGETVDVPMNCVEDVYVRSHYGTMSLTVPGSPLPDEIALIFCVANRGRVNARVGGKTWEEARSAAAPAA